jgi:protein TonB
MLETSLLESSGRAKTRKPATLLVSTVLHAVAITALILIPMLRPQALPLLVEAYGLPLPPTPEPPRVPEPISTVPVVQTEVMPDPTDFITPTVIPDRIAISVDEPVQTTPIPVVRGSGSGPLLPSILGSKAETAPLPPPPLPPAPVMAPPPPTRVHSAVQQANLIVQVKPQYPQLARQVRVQGVVILEATISKEGDVHDVRIISGHPLLTEAAREAVEQWRYRPTILNGEPIEVITTITVTFSLQ